jgi:hypothetical protein
VSGLKREEGWTSIAVVAVLVLLSAAAAGGHLVLRSSIQRERRSAESAELRRRLEGEARRVVEELTKDPTPASDSFGDPVWLTLGTRVLPPDAVSLEDVSSRLNPNWLQKDLLSRTGLRGLLLFSGAEAVLQQRREDAGFSPNLDTAYGDLFLEGALRRYFTPFAYANINVSDEFALRALYALRTGNRAGASDFHARIQGLRAQGRQLRRDELAGFLGMDAARLLPVLNAEPLCNVHFIDESLLEQLLSCPGMGVPDPVRAVRTLNEIRRTREISEDQLPQVIGAPAGSRIYQYLGVITWFWRVTITRGSAREQLIVARVPASPAVTAVFEVVEERFSR